MATLRSVLKERYKARDEYVRDQIIGGKPANYEEYRYMIGYLRGMWDLWHDDLDPILLKQERMELEGEIDEQHE